MHQNTHDFICDILCVGFAILSGLSAIVAQEGFLEKTYTTVFYAAVGYFTKLSLDWLLPLTKKTIKKLKMLNNGKR